MKTKNLLQWIRVRKAREGTVASSDGTSHLDSTVECPGSNDVIFRGGQAYLCHPGNVMFRSLIETRFEEHSRSPNSEGKTSITWWVISQVEKNGGRFLVWDNGWWIEMTDKQQMRAKVANAFKDQKRRIRALSNCQDMQSSTFKFERQDGKKRKLPDGVESSGSRATPGMFCGIG